MSTGGRAALAVTACLAQALPAAADTGARADHSGILVWSFLGLCALVVLAQAAPAVMLFVELAKGAWKARSLAHQKVRR